MVTVQNLSINFGERDLFKNLGFFISEKERIGLIGKNGAGKSTLMKILAGIQNPSSGEVIISKDRTTGYLPQEMEHAENTTILEEASKAFEEVALLETKIEKLTQQLTERTDYESQAYQDIIQELSEANDRLTLLGAGNMEQQIQKVLTGLGFEDKDMNRKMSEFSGGWKMRVELAKLLLQQPDMLLLDEPTNHLDIESIEWLEGFLMDYMGAIIMISHDKVFLDTISKRTIEITGNKVYDVKANYSKYLDWRVEELERQNQAFKNQQKYVEDTKKLIEKFRAKKNKAAFAQTLIRKLDKMDKIELDEFENAEINFAFPPAPRSGKVVIKAEDLEKTFDKQIFRDVDLIVSRQSKVALVGKNGAGKTTFTRIVMGMESHQGEMTIGHNVSIGYYAQNQTDHLDPNKTVFEILDDEAKGEIRTRLRALLGAFLFSGEDIDKKVKVLSGGEKARLALCKLLLEPYNLLILDEPTNHLDIQSKEVLKSALQDYDGTLMVVSHDRDFLSGLTELVYEVTPSGLKEYIGDIKEFLNSKRADSIAAYEADIAVAKKEKTSDSTQKNDYQDRKNREKKKRKLTNAISKAERVISETEEKMKALEKEIASLDYSDQKKADFVLAEYESLKQENETALETWENSQIELEELEGNA
ncbi:MAG: ABC-F family ATP-binding cassette domain-containing protein [Flavobacteriales bacterium]|nr:ABC-F family ATP-binding cassette domain-containing protein [Flavobacteriales bacterium]